MGFLIMALLFISSSQTYEQQSQIDNWRLAFITKTLQVNFYVILNFLNLILKR